jgi:adenine-specific DNA-methyltransferase
LLNDVDWHELGFVCDGRFIFSQRSLAHALLPETFAEFGIDRLV